MNKKNKIIPINQPIEDYITSLELFKQYPCVPTLVAVMNKGLESNVNFEEILSCCEKLITVSDDQFYCAWGSNYYRANSKKIRGAEKFSPKSDHLIDVANVIWQFISKIKHGGLVLTAAGVLNYFDWNAIGIQEDETASDPDEKVELSQDHKDAIEQIVKAIVDGEKASRNYADISKKHNLEMFPQGAALEGVFQSRPEFKRALEYFSEYLLSYFKDKNDLEIPDLGIHKKVFDISKENRVLIGKIVSIILFKSLIQDEIYKGQSLSFKTYFDDRINYLSSYQNISELHGKIGYLIAISNLLMICGVLDIDTSKNNIATIEELKRNFLEEADSENYNHLSILLIPKAGFPSILSAIDPWEGDLDSDKNFGDLFVELSYGVKTNLDEESIDAYLDNTLDGLDVKDDLKIIVENNIKEWILPLSLIEKASHLSEDYDLLEYRVVSERISKALKLSDTTPNDACIFSREDIDDVNIFLWHNERSHPALFAREFSNKARAFNTSPSDWLGFISALENYGQYQFACALASATLTIQGIRHYYDPELIDRLPPAKTSQLLYKLSNHKNFTYVEQGLRDFFDLYKDAPAIYIGSLESFSFTKTNLKLASITSIEEDKYEIYKKQIKELGIAVNNLETEAYNLIIKGYAMSKDQALLQMKLYLGAITNYVIAIEAELRSRIIKIDEALIEELGYLRIDVASKGSKNHSSQSSIKGLVSIAKLLKNFNHISEKSKSKLLGLKKLSEHEEINFFIDSIYKLTSIRNPIQHGDLESINEGKLSAQLLEVEKILFSDGFLKILCDTK